MGRPIDHIFEMRIVEEVLLDFLSELVELAAGRYSDAHLEKYSKQFPTEFAKWKAAEAAVKEQDKAVAEAKKAANDAYKGPKQAFYNAVRNYKQLASKIPKLRFECRNAINEFYQAISKAQYLELAKKAEEERKAREEQNHYQRTFGKEYREVRKWKSYVLTEASVVSCVQKKIDLYKKYIAMGYTRYEKYLGYVEKTMKERQERLNRSKARLAVAESVWNAKVAAEKPKYLAQV